MRWLMAVMVMGCASEVWSDPLCYRDRVYCESERAVVTCVGPDGSEHYPMGTPSVVATCDESGPRCVIREDLREPFEDAEFDVVCIR